MRIVSTRVTQIHSTNDEESDEEEAEEEQGEELAEAKDETTHSSNDGEAVKEPDLLSAATLAKLCWKLGVVTLRETLACAVETMARCDRSRV
jgi:hypothetical protein